ncbi:hypothetical protein I5I61_09690 [Pseudomonas nitroreducens]|uniref:Uncharacterized protein n=1 Tax=Pseudomonas nitroreducens TaxID=46680 RepID=A0ABS0KI20_PSENT|nr:hypothetical protein [Pseudomonas nitroreducens]MBG6287715.1 hypothetical protein [Pseudomonas nitroreducens]
MTEQKHSACPFCGGEVDPTGWLRGDGVRGPECDDCGATAPSIEVWEQRSHLADQIGSYPIGKGFLQEFFAAMKASARSPEVKEVIDTAAGVVGALQRQVEGLAALAQPSPAPELERPEVVGYCDPNHIQRMRDDQISGYMVHDEKGIYTCEPLMTVAQHERIVAAHLDNARYNASAQDKVILQLKQEHDAAQARVAELEKQEPVAFVVDVQGYKRLICATREEAASNAEHFEKRGRKSTVTPLYAAPVAQAGQVPEGWKLVPIEPTEWPLEAGVKAYNAAVKYGCEQIDCIYDALHEMLAAAPAQGGE